MRRAAYSEGDVIFHEGESSLEAYRILSGKVEITIKGKHRPVILAQLGDGDIFGEMAMIEERPRSATARCTADTECEVMSPGDFQEAILRNPHRLLPYLAAFFERLRTVNDRLHLEMRLRAESRAAAPQQSFPPPAQTATPQAVAARFQLMTEQFTQTPVATSHSVVLSPMTPLCASMLPEGLDSLEITKFPFRIGRKGTDQVGRHTVFSANDLLIADTEPYQISRSHCSIEREGDRFFIRDRGSTLGTIVNDVPIGVNHTTLTGDLRAGSNRFTVGSARSPYKFVLELK